MRGKSDQPLSSPLPSLARTLRIDARSPQLNQFKETPTDNLFSNPESKNQPLTVTVKSGSNLTMK